MVAIIKTGHSLQRILNYNENKVKEGVARFISASNYPIDAEKLSFNQKLNRLLKQAALNENVTRNSVHVSLNFDPSERLSDGQLKAIADAYMQKIGFGEQPFLGYQHFDAGHPHIHIVSVKIRPDGSRIDTQNIGKNQSEKARKEIEISFGLVKAGGLKTRQYDLKSAYAKKVQYGKSDSRRAISNVLDAVLNTYKYTSLPELNAVLKLYNVLADRGSESSKVYLNKGLLYRIIDDHGKFVGVPIKASSFYNKPTLKFLQEKFSGNDAARQSHKARTKNTIDLALLKQKPESLEMLIKMLEKEGINTVLRQNADGIIYGITYVDHHTKCVFKGSGLGKQYSAKAIQERYHKGDQAERKLILVDTKEQAGSQKNIATPTETSPALIKAIGPAKHSIGIDVLPKALDVMMVPEFNNSYVSYQLKGKNKKKKRKRISDNQ
jgi:hypothetical protein